MGSEDEEEDLRPTTHNKGNKRLLSSPSSSPNKTSQKGGFMAKKRKLVNPKAFFQDSPISAASPDETKPAGSQSKKTVDARPLRLPLSQDRDFLQPNPVAGSKSSENRVPLPYSQKSDNPEVAPVDNGEDDDDKAETDSDDDAVNTTASRRDPFRPEEDVQIIRFIADSKRYADVKGNTLWEFIEKKCPKVCPGRTSQSLKERFRKRIVPKLDAFVQSKDLTKAELERFKEYSGQGKKPGPSKKKK